VLLGRAPNDVRGFQRDAGLWVDGDPGPDTRGALHRLLAGLAPVPAVSAEAAKLARIAAIINEP